MTATELGRATVATVTPFTVQLPGGATVPARKVTGLTYTAGQLVALISQDPEPGIALPIT